jgi:hypothetical protein
MIIFMRYFKLYAAAGIVGSGIASVQSFREGDSAVAIICVVCVGLSAALYYIARDTKPDFFLLQFWWLIRPPSDKGPPP